MTISRYEEFFGIASGDGRQPFPWQVALAAQDPLPSLLDIPTGLGKTAGVVLAWAWARYQQRVDTPRRLVFCLPMRTLVEQTCDAATAWMQNLGPSFEQPGLQVPVVHRLLGGHTVATWDLHPEQPAIIIGTQDMLVSRALNRGYGMSPYRWGMHFGLLNNDTLWVYDETQLMGPALPTSAQLHGFRASMGTALPSRSLWMSATLGTEALNTIDHPCSPTTHPAFGLTATDRHNPNVVLRINASKRLELAPVGTPWGGGSKTAEYMDLLAATVLAEHVPGTLTLVVVNRVTRAQDLLQRLQKRVDSGTQLALVHSRFRSGDRKTQMATLLAGDGDRIVVATQAVEAGVDVSAQTLVTELAPWSSLVQRFGRCNRYGEKRDARILVIDPSGGRRDDSVKDVRDSFLPYLPTDFAHADERLLQLSERGEAGPAALSTIPPVREPSLHPVIRRKDLISLFDTTSDLTGYELDIARYIRDGDDREVFVAWRLWEHDDELQSMSPELEDFELVRVPLHQARAIAKKLATSRKDDQKSADKRSGLQAVLWTPALSESGAGRKLARWEPAEEGRLRTGMTLMLHASFGGYRAALGFLSEDVTKIPADVVSAESLAAVSDDAGTLSDDPASLAYQAAVPLDVHTEHVVSELRSLLGGLKAWPPESEMGNALLDAARWHDAGKAHPSFQSMLYGRPRRDHEPLLAKSDRRTNNKRNEELPGDSEGDAMDDGPDATAEKQVERGLRKYFRHELASAILYLQLHAPTNRDAHHDLIAWVISAHHGKVGLTLRPHPQEPSPSDGSAFAGGVHDQDPMPFIDLGDSVMSAATSLNLEDLLRFGTGSWTHRMAALRDSPDLGPFRLAWLESLLRAADGRASRTERDIPAISKEAQS
jgi:CRISPR-associated endonuclease/helicase Cas3